MNAVCRCVRNFLIWTVIGVLFLLFGGLAGYGYRQMTKDAAGTSGSGTNMDWWTGVDWSALVQLSLGGGVALGLIVLAVTIASPRGAGWALGLGAVVLLLFVIFVWPTPYKYYRDKEQRLIRVHRLTGSGDYVVPAAR